MSNKGKDSTCDDGTLLGHSRKATHPKALLPKLMLALQQEVGQSPTNMTLHSQARCLCLLHTHVFGTEEIGLARC